MSLTAVFSLIAQSIVPEIMKAEHRQIQLGSQCDKALADYIRVSREDQLVRVRQIARHPQTLYLCSKMRVSQVYSRDTFTARGVVPVLIYRKYLQRFLLFHPENQKSPYDEE